MKKLNIAIIGAGSYTFSRKIVGDLCITEGLNGCHVTFMDIDAERLNLIYDLAVRMSRELKAGMTFSKTTSREEALSGADFVLNTALIGGYEYIDAQKRLGNQCGYFMGAWLHYFRQMAFFRELADDMARLCPNAWLILSANPVFEGCTLLCRTSEIKTIGLCHGHHAIQKVGEEMGLDPKKTDGRAVGFNHWIWLSDFRYEGRDAMPLLHQYLEEHPFDETKMFLGPAAVEQFRMYGMLPIGDTIRFAAWWLHIDMESRKKWFGADGGRDAQFWYNPEQAEKWSREIREIAEGKQKVTDTFRPQFSGEQIVPIINSLTNHQKGIYQVNIPNEGQIIKGIAEDVAVECQAVIDGAGIHPISESPFPKSLMIKAMLPRWSYAELMVEAVRQHDPQLLLFYLLEDHRTRDYAQAELYMTEWLNMEGNGYMKDYFGM